MFFEFDDTQLEFQSIARAFLEKACPEHTLVRRIDQRHVSGVDLDIHRRLCSELDVLGVAVPLNRGGVGAGLVELAILFKEMGRVLYGGPILSSVLTAEVLVRADSEGQHESILKALIGGKALGAVAGLSGYADSELRAVKHGSRFRVSGRCQFVFDAAEADTIVVFAASADGINCLLINDAQSLLRKSVNQLDLTRSAASLEFSDAEASRIGTISSASIARERAYEMAALCIAAEQVGVAERSLEIMVEHSKIRKQFGVPIGSFQAVKHRCADVAVVVEAATCSAQHAAWSLSRAIEPDQPWASLAKSICVEASVKATSSAIQVLGGLGFTWEHPMHLFYRRSIASRQSFDSTRTHREFIASRLLGDG
jgi:alkylation response protein AidB-like acyl-CoA dehydrogenase